MANNTRSGIKKSEFTALTSVPDSATLDFVNGNQNQKISYSDFLSQLEVTGSIEQTGNSTGAPVLDKQGTLNAIRNLVGGFGVSTTIDSQNSIQISTNYSFDQVGAPIVENVSAEAPNFRSIVGGQDVDVVGSGGTITVSANTDGLKPENQIIVNQVSDFGSPSGGEYQLQPKTEYYIGSQLTITDALRFGHGTIINGTVNASSLTYTGTGGMFRGADGAAVIQNLTISCPNATAFSFVGTLGQGLVNVRNILVLSCNKIGEVGGVLAFTLEGSNALNYTDGLEIVGTGMAALSVSRFASGTTNASATAIDLGSNVFSTLEIMNVVFQGVTGTTGISGLASSGNVAPGQVADISSCEFFPDITPLSGIAQSDIRYVFLGNSAIPDSVSTAFISFNGNATNTVIAAAATPVKVVGTFSENIASKFTTDSTGRIIFIGERVIAASVDIVISAGTVAGTDDATVFLAKGNTVSQPVPTVIVDSGQVQELAANDPRTMITLWELNLVEGDFLEIWIQNDDTAEDILVSDAKFRIRG